MDTSSAGLSPVLQVIIAVLGLGGLGFGGVVTFKTKNRETDTDGAQKLIDQYQEGRAEDLQRITALEVKVTSFEKRDTLSKVYIFALMDHIYKGSPPPPPAMPEGLM